MRTRMLRIGLASLLASLALSVAPAHAASVAYPTATPTPGPTATPAPSPTPSPTPIPSPTPSTPRCSSYTPPAGGCGSCVDSDNHPWCYCSGSISDAQSACRDLGCYAAAVDCGYNHADGRNDCRCSTDTLLEAPYSR